MKGEDVITLCHMEIKLAKHSGFCFGVKRALAKTIDLLERGDESVYSIGDLIHNPQVVNELKMKGLRVVEGLKGIKSGVIIIRAHGFPPSLIDQAKRRGLKLLDTTCPFVKRAQNILRSLDGEGYKLIIVGDKDHPEVKGLVGFAHNGILVVERPQDVKRLNLEGVKKVGLLAQTTQSKEDFQAVANELIKDGSFELRIFNTICEAVAFRQDEARNLAKKCDLMLVVGGKRSANTRTLTKLCRREGTKVYHIEGPDDLDPNWIRRRKRVGIIGGTSTPQRLIGEVMNRLKGRG